MAKTPKTKINTLLLDKQEQNNAQTKQKKKPIKKN
jgi:hypothetical protein